MLQNYTKENVNRKRK